MQFQNERVTRCKISESTITNYHKATNLVINLLYVIDRLVLVPGLCDLRILYKLFGFVVYNNNHIISGLLIFRSTLDRIP